MRRRFLFCLLLLGLLLLLPFCAQANEINRLYVWDGSVGMPQDGSLAPGAIQWYSRNGVRYLFLPSGLDSSKLFVHFTGSAKSFTANGVTVPNNSVTDVFVPGTTVTISNGGNSYRVAVMQSANAASVYIKTKSGGIAYISESKKNHESGSLYVLSEQGQPNYGNAFEYIRVRGNYSFYPYKKSFHIKLEDGAPILGMPSAKTWLLIANYCDNSMLRNALTFDLASAAGMAHTTEYRYADVYVNTVYYGFYLLTEKVQIQKNRIDAFDLEKATEKANEKDLSSYRRLGHSGYSRNTYKYSSIPNDPKNITGGYLLQLELDERYSQTSCGFVTSHGQSVLLKSPEYASKAQVEYIRSLVQSFENAIWAEDGIDPETGKHFSEIADMDSLVGKYLIEEISKNMDANKSSFYLYKYEDSVSEKLFFGPVWDYDIAYGNYNASYYKKYLTDPEGLLAATDDYKRYYWFPQLYKREEFKAAVKEAYQERFRPCLEVILGLREPTDDTGRLSSLDEYEALLSPAGELNFTRWRTFNADEFPVRTGADLHENFEYLRHFLSVRMAYLDSLWLD